MDEQQALLDEFDDLVTDLEEDLGRPLTAEETTDILDYVFDEDEDEEPTIGDVENAFCPTGEGGGVDATCPPTGGAGKGDDYDYSAQGDEDPDIDYENPSSELRPGEIELPYQMSYEDEEGLRDRDMEAALDRWGEAGRPGGDTVLKLSLVDKDSDKIIVGQRGVRKSLLQAKIDGKAPLGTIEGIKFRGKFYINDGHHTLMALKALGRKHAKIEVADLDKAGYGN